MSQKHSLTEFRIVLPLTVEEYQVGQLWSVAEASRIETGGGEGVQVLVNEPFSTSQHVPVPSLFCNGKLFNNGQYTYKIYHMNAKVPSWLKMLIPKGSMELHEESWNAYPYAKTVIKNPLYLKDDFYIIIETFHASDRGASQNIHNLRGRDLDERNIVMIDIANDTISSQDYRAEFDPSRVAAMKANRPAIPKDGTGHWMLRVNPVMCCYKLVKVYFKWFGLQRKLESYILSQERRLFFLFHRQVWCWLDNYYNLNMANIRNLEDQVRSDLERSRIHEPLRGTNLS